MRLRTQFGLLVIAAVLSPLILYAGLFFVQVAFPDKGPVLNFAAALSEAWHQNGKALPTQTVENIIAEQEVPSNTFIILADDGRVIYSGLPLVGQNQDGRSLAAMLTGVHHGRHYLLILDIDPKDPDSPVLAADQEAWEHRDVRATRKFVWLFGLMGLLLLTSGTISLFILGSLNRSIKRLMNDVGAVAAGELDHKVGTLGTTEFRQLGEAVNRMRESLKDAIHRQSLLFMGMSHDLKTPVSLILGYTDALSDGVYSKAEERERSLAIVQAKARQLQDLIDEFMNLIKLQTDSPATVARPMDTTTFLSSVARRFADDATLLEHQFSWGFGKELAPKPETPIPASAFHPILAERALENLFTNAVRYSPSGSRITMRIDGPDASRHQNWSVTISDEGSGIPDADIPFVFDPFYRGSRTRENGGHGLGLAVVRTVANLHGWNVHIDKGGPAGSEQGTSVHIVCPS